MSDNGEPVQMVVSGPRSNAAPAVPLTTIVSLPMPQVLLISTQYVPGPFTVKVDAASEAAKKAIEAVGGKVETPNPKA